MQEVQRRTMTPPSLRRVYWFFHGRGYVAIAALIMFVILASFMGYQAQDAMLSAIAITLGFGGVWMLGFAFKC